MAEFDYAAPQNIAVTIDQAERAEQSALTALQQAQADLAQAESRKPMYPGSNNRQALAEWHKAVQDISSFKALVSERQRIYQQAQNTSAGARYSARLQTDAWEKQQKRELAEAQRAMLHEHDLKEELRRHWQGTTEEFEAAWPSLHKKLLKDEALASAEAARNAPLPARYDF